MAAVEHLVANGSLADLPPPAIDADECICSDLQHEDYSPLYAWFNYIVIIILLPSLSLFGLGTNLLNAFVYTRPRMRNSSSTYLLALAFSDFFVVLTGLFIFWIDSARSYIPQLVQAPYTTVYTLPFGYMAQSCSIYFTVAAAFDCYVSVCWRGKAKRHCTVRSARRIVAAIVLASVLYNSLRFPQFNLRKCIHEGSREQIVEICPTSLFFQINTVYNVYLYMLAMTLFPFSVLLLLNLLIICHQSLEASRRLRPPPPNKRSCSSLVSSLSSPLTSTAVTIMPRGNGAMASSNSPANGAAGAGRPRRANSIVARGTATGESGKQRHIAAALLGGSLAQFPALPKAAGSDETITMIMVVVLFLCCNTLALIVNLIETFFEPDALLLNLLSDASNFLVVFNSSVNCVIYLIFNKEYRDVFLFHFVRLKSRFYMKIAADDWSRQSARQYGSGSGKNPPPSTAAAAANPSPSPQSGKGTTIGRTMMESAAGENKKRTSDAERRAEGEEEEGDTRSPVWQTAAKEEDGKGSGKDNEQQEERRCPCCWRSLAAAKAEGEKGGEEEEEDSGCDAEENNCSRQLLAFDSDNGGTAKAKAADCCFPLPPSHSHSSSSCCIAEVKIFMDDQDGQEEKCETMSATRQPAAQFLVRPLPMPMPPSPRRIGWKMDNC